MKKIKFLFIALILCVCFSIVPAKAANKTSFTIYSATYSWKYDQLNYAYKNISSSWSPIEWNSSSQSSSHKMVFQVCKTNGTRVGSSGTLTYLSTDAVRSNLTTGTGTAYSLSARRENIIDSATTVSGYWMP